jgi:thiosulfate/3-mercaptopyruvate sulfurtransferase
MRRSPLISAEELAQLLDAPPADFAVLDARPGKAAYAAKHLAGALYADLNSTLSTAEDPDADPSRGGRHPLPSIERWAQCLGAWGIGPKTTVVVYDDHDGSNAAARAWWMLRSAGHENVRVLDGGLGAAISEGLHVTTEVPQPKACKPYPAAEWHWPTVDVAFVDKVRQDPQWKVLDVRSEPRFRGETEPIDPIAGHIPGAVNLPFTKNLEHGGRFKPAKALHAQYERLLEGTPAERLIVHCGSGVTACHTLLALNAAGFDGAALYVGSWSEWCRNELPRAGRGPS